ncbi:antitoxin [Nocardioides sp.]|uniref:antitoxin n=1 Tax=Nocardioides sp. TaxID=35761 RepID=UPI002CF55138|nr:antitoxin [Nocardioides sp.]HXH80715.1 antitoxin [Nocardioides sp.]
MSEHEPKNISDKLKQTIDELDIDRHVNDFVIQVESAFTTARDKIATLAAERGDEVERLLDKMGTTIDERTEGRYASHVDKVRETVLTGVCKLAEQRPADTDPVWPVDEIETTPTPAPTTPVDSPADDPADPLDQPGTGS